MSNWRRVTSSGRLAGVDLARGLAVIGMLTAHLLDFRPFAAADPGTWIIVAQGRSSILFAVLAGLSTALVSGGARPVEGVELTLVRQRLAVRALVVGILGVALVQLDVPVSVILPAYAILFLLAIPFVHLRAKTLLMLGATLAAVLPFAQVKLDALSWWVTPTGFEVADLIGWNYPFTSWIAFVLVGIGLGRLDLSAVATQAKLAAGGMGVAAIAYTLDETSRSSSTIAGDWRTAWTAEPHSTGVLETLGSGGFAVGTIGVCLVLCRASAVRWASLPVRSVGTMPLTAYCAHLVSWAVVAAIVLEDRTDGDAFRALEPWMPSVFGLALFCTAWAVFLGRGPLERMLDRFVRLVPGHPHVSRGRR